MNGFVFAIGLALLVALAVSAGVLIAGERHHRERVRLDARRWELWRWEQELINAAEFRGCPSCELLRRRSELERPMAGP